MATTGFKRPKFLLYNPLPQLILIYDQIEAFFGRDVFRLLYTHRSAYNEFLSAGADGPSTPGEKVWKKASCLWSFTAFVREFQPLLDGSPLLDYRWLQQLLRQLQILRRTMLEVNFVVTRGNRKYSDDQIYDPFTDPNCAAATPTAHLGAMEVLCRLQKVFGRFGFLPPIKFDSAPGLGLHMRASAEIEAHTILGEYSGVVESRRWNSNPFLAVSDSIYDIVRAGNSNENLCIVPEPYTSIPRYINGINNHIPTEAEKVNVYTQTFRLTNQHRCQHLITLTRKAIKAGNQLVLDYNTGVSPDLLVDFGYPTKNFAVID